MKIVGIIAEFNPFHNGHKYLISKAKEVCNADAAVIVVVETMFNAVCLPLLIRLQDAKWQC